MAALTWEKKMPRSWIRRFLVTVLAVISLMLGGCNANVGVGFSVGVPIGNHGHLSVGTGRWF
jgi:predicted small secreted protein